MEEEKDNKSNSGQFEEVDDGDNSIEIKLLRDLLIYSPNEIKNQEEDRKKIEDEKLQKEKEEEEERKKKEEEEKIKKEKEEEEERKKKEEEEK